MIERVCVIGAGVIGGLYAAHLARVAEVSVLTRRPEHAATLSERGLTISGKHEFSASVFATAEAARLPDFELGIVATKATQVAQAAGALEGRSPTATIMTVQNGLGAEQLVTAAGPWPVISGVTFMSGLRHDDAHIEYELDTATWIGPYAATSTPYETVQEVERLLRAAELEAEAFPDLLPAQWSKLIFNATVNAVAALTELPHVSLFAKEENLADLGHLVHELMDEGKRVAAAAGIELHEDPWEMNVLAVQRGETGQGDYAHVPSMLEDVLAKRPTEVDFITGALVREGQRLGVPVPRHTAMYRLVKGKETSW